MLFQSSEPGIEALKKVTVTEIENSFAKALRELLGVDYSLTITKIDFENEPNLAKVNLSISSQLPF